MKRDFSFIKKADNCVYDNATEYEDEYEEVDMDDEDKLESVPFKRIIIFSTFVTTLEQCAIT